MAELANITDAKTEPPVVHAELACRIPNVRALGLDRLPTSRVGTRHSLAEGT
jgi:hypothetical protein